MTNEEKHNEKTIQQSFAREAHKNGFKTVVQRFKYVKLVEALSLMSDVLQSFACTWTKSHKKTPHSSLLGKNDKGAKRGGKDLWDQ